jgi:hypothetical protein
MSKTKTLTYTEHGELAGKLIEVLKAEPDPVRQQAAIELVTMRHALRMGSETTALVVAAGVHKHVRQLIEQAYREAWV